MVHRALSDKTYLSLGLLSPLMLSDVVFIMLINCKMSIVVNTLCRNSSNDMDGSEEFLNETLSELENYAKCSGLKVNFSKTHVVWKGSKQFNTDSIKTKWELNWGVDRFKLLGITLDTDLDKILALNFSPKISNLKTTITYWNRRNITP